MSDAYPLTEADPAKLGFAAKPLQHLDRLIRQHIEEGRYPGAQIALGAARAIGAVPQLWRRADRAGARAGDRRDAVSAVQPDQGADQCRGVDLDRGGQALLYGPGRRPPAGIRPARQGRDHPASGDDASGRVSLRRRDPRDLDRPCPDAGRGLRLLARLDAGDAAAIPPARGASDPGDGDRGGDRPGLPRRDPRTGIGAAWVWPAISSSACRRPSRVAAPTPMRPSRATTRPSSRRQACRAAAAMRRRAAWRRSTRCCSAAAGSARCGCCRRGSSAMSPAAIRASAATTRWAASRCIAGLGRMSAATATASAGSARSRPPRPLAMAAPGRRIPGRTRQAGCRSPTSPISSQPDPFHSARLDRVANLVHAAID